MGRPAKPKEKSPGLVVNKAAEIRRIAGLLVSQGELPRPITIRERLKRKGIVVTSQQVSMALSNTEFAYRRNTTQSARPLIVIDPLSAVNKVSHEEIGRAGRLVKEMGSFEKALDALVAYGQLKREPTQEQHYGGA